MSIRRVLTLCAAVWACEATALELTLPSNAELTAGEDLGLDVYALPTASFDGVVVPARKFEGFVQRQAWRVAGAGITPLQILQPLRAQLEDKGYTLIFECADDDCGGFDYRFGTSVLNAPDMIVDLDDFHVISLLKGDEGSPSGAVNILVSHSQEAIYAQITSVSVEKTATISVDKGDAITGTASTPDPETPAPADQNFGDTLAQVGFVALSDLVFKTGSADLGDGPFASLADVASYLQDNPSRRIALVGHTDAVGGLSGNIALSKRRAGSVRDRLTGTYGVPAAQLEAEGVGYLSPIATNLTEAGREANRRVEAVLISTE